MSEKVDIFLFGHIDAKKAEAVSQKIIESKGKQVNLYISSEGGFLHPGFAIIGAMSVNKNVTTIGLGRVASTAFAIFLSGKKRTCHKNCLFFYHGISDTIEGEIQQLKEMVAANVELQNQADQIVLNKTLITKKKLTSIKKKSQTWMITSDEALDLRIVEGVCL
ncbi:MAG: ATP-dependent Clp protease proteolytic subunit [Candidatus Aminicenantes bacterium]|nr:ATP-dependent Clp protease proteolytic subunit [Candidatus Aminicenantes bacterium]